MLKLYYIPNSRATRPRWILEELGVPYELVRVPPDLAERKASDYVQVHPHARVPALVDGDVKVFESLAIALYLADKFADKGLAPALDAADRGTYLQWMVYSMVTLESPIYQIYRHSTGLPEEKRSAAMLEEAQASFAEVAGLLESTLSTHPFINGKEFTAADVMIGSTLAWARGMKLLDNYPAMQDYVQRLSQRPAFQKARGD